jgi:hypothetical protein
MSSYLTIRDRTAPGSSNESATDPIHFQQQGTVDWTSLTKNTVSASIDVLSRISAAGIDPYTIVVSRAVGGRLVWSSLGRKRFDQAVQSCQAKAAYLQVLWFGFGVKHIVNILTSTEQGATCAALCACLAECYSVSYASEIMIEMTKASGLPFDAAPSLQQWRALVDSCAGLLANSTFGIRAEHFMRLDGETRVANHASGCSWFRQTRGVAAREAIAEALIGLASLSRRVLQQMTISGQADAGFIAAIADWLLDIDIEIRRGSDGSILFTNCATGTDPQLLVLYEKGEGTGALQCIGKTYRLFDASEIIKTEDGPKSTLVLSGRVPWAQAFEVAFGEDFRKLIKMGQSFGRAIGCAGRIFEGLVRAEDSVPSTWLERCCNYFQDSHGKAYVGFTCAKFPELAHLQDIMMVGASTPSFETARADFEAQLSSLALGCGCQRCISGGDTSTELNEYCIVIIAQTIIKLISALSGILTELNPSRAGLELLYDLQLALIHKQPRADPSFARLIIESDPACAQDPPLLEIAETIFGGKRYTGKSSGQGMNSAISENGICYYLDVLREPTTGAANIGRVHVIPGRIEYFGRPYHLLADGGSQLPRMYEAPTLERSPIYPDPTAEVLEKIRSCSGGRLELLVKEHITANLSTKLLVEYAVSVNNAIQCSFKPAKAAYWLSRKEGLVVCGRSCKGSADSILQDFRDDHLSTSGDKSRRMTIGSNDVLMVHGGVVESYIVACDLNGFLVQRDECIACCARYRIADGSKYFAIIFH